MFLNKVTSVFWANKTLRRCMTTTTANCVKHPNESILFRQVKKSFYEFFFCNSKFIFKI